MKAKIKVEKEVELKTLHVSAGARYWEDSTVDGKEDTNGDLIPCRDGDYWKPIIDIDSGKILNWKEGTTASLHYKVCDDGEYVVLDADDNEVMKKEGYVPATMCPDEDGFGDYIIMRINEHGVIADWKFDPDDFKQDDDE